MKRNSEKTYWMTNKSWYHIDTQRNCFILTDLAPERARRSFAMWSHPEKLTLKDIWKRYRVKIICGLQR